MKKLNCFGMSREDFKQDLLSKARLCLENYSSDRISEKDIEDYAKRMLLGDECEGHTFSDVVGIYMCSLVGHMYMEKLSYAHDLGKEAAYLGVEYRDSTGEVKCPRCNDWYKI